MQLQGEVSLREQSRRRRCSAVRTLLTQFPFPLDSRVQRKTEREIESEREIDGTDVGGTWILASTVAAIRRAALAASNNRNNKRDKMAAQWQKAAMIRVDVIVTPPRLHSRPFPYCSALAMHFLSLFALSTHFSLSLLCVRFADVQEMCVTGRSR